MPNQPHRLSTWRYGLIFPCTLSTPLMRIPRPSLSKDDVLSPSLVAVAAVALSLSAAYSTLKQALSLQSCQAVITGHGGECSSKGYSAHHNLVSLGKVIEPIFMLGWTCSGGLLDSSSLAVAYFPPHLLIGLPESICKQLIPVPVQVHATLLKKINDL